MKVLVLGASGMIGGAVCDELKSDTEIVTANSKSGDYQVNLADPGSITALIEQVGQLDAIVCAASRGVVFKPVTEMTITDYQDSLQQKLLGQLNLALQGVSVLNDGGSITLTTGVFNQQFVAGGSAASMVNNAVEGFVKVAALEMPRGIRINVVSPNLLAESAALYQHVCPGFETVAKANVAKAYRRSVYGIETGKVFRAI